MRAASQHLDLALKRGATSDTAVSKAIDLYYLNLTNAGTDAGLIKCQRTIGKETTKFLLAKDKALRKCRKLVDKGTLTGPCPDGPATNPDGLFAKTAQGAIAKAESKKVGKICKACDTASVDGMTCTGPDRFTPAQIGFAKGDYVTQPRRRGRQCGLSTYQRISQQPGRSAPAPC